MSSPVATNGPPIQLASTGLPRSLATLRIVRIMAGAFLFFVVGSVMSCGVKITITPSQFSSRAVSSSALAYRVASASPSTSTGLFRDHDAGNTLFNSAIVCAEIGVSSPPPMISASVASTPGPPALVTIVIRLPLGRG